MAEHSGEIRTTPLVHRLAGVRSPLVVKRRTDQQGCTYKRRCTWTHLVDQCFTQPRKISFLQPIAALLFQKKFLPYSSKTTKARLECSARSQGQWFMCKTDAIGDECWETFWLCLVADHFSCAIHTCSPDKSRTQKQLYPSAFILTSYWADVLALHPGPV